MLPRFSLVLALGAIPVSALAQTQAPTMASYRAVYDLALDGASNGRGVDAARGRIVLEFTGSACEGYALSFRQVTELSGGEIGRRVSDLRSTTFEDGDAKTFRFKSETRPGSGATEIVDGVAERKNRQVLVTISKPKAGKLTLAADAAFPTQHLIELVESARAGQSTFTRKVYDGSDETKDAYDTFALIGTRKMGAMGLEEDLIKAGWDQVPRWPVSISFFPPGETDKPAYVISYELFENGFGRALKLDYDVFALNGTLTKLEPIATKPCN